MNTSQIPSRFFLFSALAAFLLGIGFIPGHAADHLDAPGLTSPAGDGRLDITDVFVFQSPSQAGHTVLIMNINPFAGILSPTTFHSKATYEFKIDNDGDAKENITFRVNFSEPDTQGVQALHLRVVPALEGNTFLARGQTGDNIAVKGGGILRAGLFDDPFFLDVDAFQGAGGRTFCDGTQNNFFGGLNVASIILELPSTRLGSSSIGVWGRTVLNGHQIDRMGRPLINGAIIPVAMKNAFNAGKPRKDTRDFGPLLGNLSPILLPDILTVNTSSTDGFFNGRRLQDDVVDILLPIITGGVVTTDCIANDSALTNTFPYLAPPNI
jgi:hypothetical protein